MLRELGECKEEGVESGNSSKTERGFIFDKKSKNCFKIKYQHCQRVKVFDTLENCREGNNSLLRFKTTVLSVKKLVVQRPRHLNRKNSIFYFQLPHL